MPKFFLLILIQILTVNFTKAYAFIDLNNIKNVMSINQKTSIECLSRPSGKGNPLLGSILRISIFCGGDLMLIPLLLGRIFFSSSCIADP